MKDKTLPLKKKTFVQKIKLQEFKTSETFSKVKEGRKILRRKFIKYTMQEKYGRHGYFRVNTSLQLRNQAFGKHLTNVVNIVSLLPSPQKSPIWRLVCKMSKSLAVHTGHFKNDA